MKKVSLSLIIVILMTISAYAQYKPFQFGLNISPGINMTKLNSDNLGEEQTSLSFNWGFTGNFYFVENYGFSTGFNVRNIKGGYTFNDKLVGDINRDITNQYLEIPLGLIMRTEKIGKMRIFGNVGYGLGISLNNKEKNFDKDDTEIKYVDEFRKIRHALIVKLGIEYCVYKSSCLTTSLVYNNNFTNIYSNDNHLEHDVMLNNICLEIGFMF